MKGLILKLKSLKAGASSATSLRQNLAEVGAREKAARRPPSHGRWIARDAARVGGHRVILGPQVTISPLGVAVETRYFRRVLDKIGVLPEIFARGEFKTAGESLARDSMSSAQREQLGALLDVLENELVDAIASGRKLALPEVRALVDGGPYRARDAVLRGLVDTVGYDDELPTLADVSVEKPVTLVSAAAYWPSNASGLAPSGWAWCTWRGPSSRAHLSRLAGWRSMNASSARCGWPANHHELQAWWW